jgi:GWxTD domain-containing protein
MCASHAISFPLRSKGLLEFWVDAASFASDSGLTWQEIYWSFKASDFIAVDTMGRKMAKFRTVILLNDSSDKLVLTESWNSMSPMPTEQMLKQKEMVMLDQIEARRVTPGNYHLIMSVTDLVGNKQGTVDTIFEVPRFEVIGISKIELSSGIVADSGEGRFIKNGLRVKPWPSRVFDEELYYYYEVYNISGKGDTTNRKFLRVMYLSEKDPQAKIISNKDITDLPGRIADYGGLKVDDLPEGLYRLRAQVSDNSGVQSSSYVNFEIKHPRLALLAEQEQINQEIAQMIQDGGEYYDRIDHLGTKQQIDLLAKLDDKGKKELLRRFWKQRDPNPETKENEALLEYAKRFRYADQNFSESFAAGRKGSLTDRGRIYIKYGPWDDRLLTTDALQKKPTDIWTYNNGRQFIFVDKAGFNKFELVYSKTSEEKTDPDYQDYNTEF